MAVHYDIITAGNADDLVGKVSEALGSGWVPQGRVATSQVGGHGGSRVSVTFYQAIMLTTND